VSEFLELFHRYAYIYKPIGTGSWVSADETWRLDDSAILKAISLQNTKYFIGARCGSKTKFAVLDIDTESKYHNEKGLNRILETLTCAGLKESFLFQSSDSGGWHLYIFFEEEIPSLTLYQQLAKLFKLTDIEVSKGTLEIFPHPSYASVGMGLRLPLQQGFAWLDKKTLEVESEREWLSATKALELFVDCAIGGANSYTDYLALKAHVSELTAAATVTPSLTRNNIVPIRAGKPFSSEHDIFVASIFGHLPLNIDAETWQKGRLFHLQGLTARSQRAEAAFCLGHYFFYGDPSRSLPALGYAEANNRERLIQEFLLANHNGFSKDIARGRAEATAQITRMSNWVPTRRRSGEIETFKPTPPISWVRENAKRKNDARRRIEEALKALRIRRRPFSTVELQKAAGCGRPTLYKHADIWRQEYEDLADGFFAACSDEYNVIEQELVGSPIETIDDFPSSLVLKEETPVGLIATRQVVFELSLQGRKKVLSEQKLDLDQRDKAEQHWRSQVAGLILESPMVLSFKELNYRLFSLSSLLTVAPYEEDAVALLLYVRQLRNELQTRRNGPTIIVPKDADDLEDSS
jgi:hypothetical protein